MNKIKYDDNKIFIFPLAYYSCLKSGVAKKTGRENVRSRTCIGRESVGREQVGSQKCIGREQVSREKTRYRFGHASFWR